MVLELQGADGVGDPLDGIRQAVGKVVHRVDAPCIAGPVVAGMDDPVHDRVAQVHVRRVMSIFARRTFGSVRKLAGPHATEQIEVLFDGPVAVGALLARFGQRAAVGADLIGGKVVHIGFALLDQIFGPLVELLEVVGGKVEVVSPVEAEPVDALLDGVDVFQLFLGRIRVVETEMAASAEIPGETEVEADGLGMADMEIAVRLRRESG